MDCRSFYLQIAGRITAEILSCQLRPGQQMQSIRRLSVQYRVNPHTVQRAMDKLKREHLLEKCGQRLFITSDRELLRRSRQQEGARLVGAFLEDMESLGYTRTEARQMAQQHRSRKGAESSRDHCGPGSFCEDGGDLLLFSKPAADPAERSAAGKAEQGRDG